MVGHTGHTVGYVRVSAADQNTARQVAALGDVDRVFTEKISAKSRNDRAELAAMLAYVRSGDTVRVKSPDRLARSTRDLLAIMDELKAKGVNVEFVDSPSLNTDTPQGAFMLSILGAVAELERATIRERQAEGIAIAKKQGTYNRAPKLRPEQVAEARQRVAEGEAVAAVARDLGVSRQTLYTAMRGEGKYANI